VRRQTHGTEQGGKELSLKTAKRVIKSIGLSTKTHKLESNQSKAPSKFLVWQFAEGSSVHNIHLLRS